VGVSYKRALIPVRKTKRRANWANPEGPITNRKLNRNRAGIRGYGGPWPTKNRKRKTLQGTKNQRGNGTTLFPQGVLFMDLNPFVAKGS